jgi:hypothetical protein
MRLASEADIHIKLCSQVFTLRATLRAAYCLNKKYGFGNLARAITEGSFTAYQDVITAGCSDVGALNALLKPFNAPGADITPLGDAILANREELLAFIAVLAGVTDQDTDNEAPASKPISFEEYHAQLYRLGTGRLGWTPGQTWEATPSEIINANEGRLAFVSDVLKSIFGSKAEDEIDTSHTDARAELNAIGDLGVTRMSEVR